jgi:hypothetical protein
MRCFDIRLSQDSGLGSGQVEMKHLVSRLRLSLACALLPTFLVGCQRDDESQVCSKRDVAGEGTWTDTATCLMWQDPPVEQHRLWDKATEYCSTLELGGYDDWRLPTLDELRSLAAGCPATVTEGTCGVTNDCLENSCWSEDCKGCPELQGPSPEGCYRLSSLTGNCMTTWTSTVAPDQPEDVWTVGFGGCHILRYAKTFATINTRCVR